MDVIAEVIYDKLSCGFSPAATRIIERAKEFPNEKSISTLSLVTIKWPHHEATNESGAMCGVPLAQAGSSNILKSASIMR